MKKNNLEYLIKREKEYQEYLKKTDQAYDEKLIRLYNQAMDRIAREIEKEYANYAKGEGITIDEAMDKVSRFEAEEFEEKAKKYVKELDFSERANYELKLYNLKIRTSRLELMKREMLLETIALADKESKMLEKRLGEVVREEINRQSAILGLSKEVRLRLIKIAAVIVASNFHGANFSDRIWANREELQKQLEIGLTRTILQGENHMLWTKKLENLMTDNGKQNALYNAKRIASTEVSRAFSEASLAAYKESGFKKYIWIAEQDSRTCSICNALDGEVFDVDGSIIGSDTPPIHPFCRCTTAAYEDKDKDEEKGYIDITDEVLDDLKDKDSYIKELKSVTIDGTEYRVGGKDVVLDYSKYEKEVAQWIADNVGGVVFLHPRILFPQKIRTPDYIWEGDSWDLKTINSHSKNTLSTAVKNIKGQSENIILDLKIDSYTDDILVNELRRIYNNKRYEYLNKTLILRESKLIGIFKRKE